MGSGAAVSEERQSQNNRTHVLIEYLGSNELSTKKDSSLGRQYLQALKISRVRLASNRDLEFASAVSLSRNNSPQSLGQANKDDTIGVHEFP